MDDKLIFLDNFEKRMEKLSYTYLIDYQVDKKSVIYDKYNIDRQDMINLVYATLCYIMDKSLKDEDCLMEDISEYVFTVLNKYFDLKNCTIENASEIARYIIVKVLRNDGKQFNFKIKNFNKNKTEIANYYLIKSIPSQIDKTVSSYKLTDEGYKLLLNTYETDQRLQVEIQSIILTESIKRRNFKSGIVTIRQMDNIIRVQIDNVREMIRQIRENIFEVKIKDFSKMYLENINIIKEQKESLLKIERCILKSQEDIRNTNFIEEETEDSLKDLDEIKKYVDNLIEQSTIMVDYHFDLKHEYLLALKTISENFNRNHLSFNKAYLQRVEDDIKTLDNMNELIQPCIKPNLSKHLNYNKIVEELRIIQEDKNEAEINVNNIEGDTLVEELKNKEIIDKYNNAVSLFLSKVIELSTLKDNFSLLDILGNLDEDEYKVIVPNIRMFTEIMVNFLRMGTIHFNELYEKNKDNFFDSYSTGKFDMVESLVRSIVSLDILNKFSYIELTKIKDEQIEVKELNDEDDIATYKVELNNVKIKIV